MKINFSSQNLFCKTQIFYSALKRNQDILVLLQRVEKNWYYIPDKEQTRTIDKI